MKDDDKPLVDEIVQWLKRNDPITATQRITEILNVDIAGVLTPDKGPAMKGNRNPFAQNSVRSMKAACKGRKVIK